VTFVVTTPQPAKAINVQVGAFPGSSTFNVSGTIAADLVTSGGVATQFDLAGAALALSNVLIALGPNASFSLTSATATLVGPPALFIGSTGATSSFDISGSELILDSGTASVCCQGAGTVNFASTPVSFVYGPGSIAEVALADLFDGTFAASLSLPLDATTFYPPTSPVVTVTFAGDLAASGTLIPEPSTALLVGIGMTSLGAARRRRRANRLGAQRAAIR
jgi:hypothetical protein